MVASTTPFDEIIAQVQALRQDLAGHPELGPDVTRTASRVVEHLRRTNLQVRPRAGFPEEVAMGVVADLRVHDAQRTVALVADMSAQSVKQASREGSARNRRRNHVAGNDAHTAMLVGAALLLHRSEVHNNVRFIWQSGGELLSDGAQAMIRDGALKDVDEVFAIHLWPGLPVGQIGLREGPIISSLDRFRLKIRGPDQNRPWPHRKVDAIRIGGRILYDLGKLSSAGDGESSEGPICCPITHFRAAQDIEGLPADAILLEGEIRALTEAERKQGAERLAAVAREGAAALGGQVELQIQSRANVTVNAAESVAKAQQRLLRELGSASVAPVEPLFFASGLHAYLEAVPGALVPLGCGSETGPAAQLLSPEFAADDQCLDLGVRVLTLLAGT